MTHLDTFSLERERFEEALRQDPPAALHIADAIVVGRFVPGRQAKRLAQSIYEKVGMRDVLECFKPGKWYPKRGLATKIQALAHDRTWVSELHGVRTKWAKGQGSRLMGSRVDPFHPHHSPRGPGGSPRGPGPLIGLMRGEDVDDEAIASTGRAVLSHEPKANTSKS